MITSHNKLTWHNGSATPWYGVGREFDSHRQHHKYADKVFKDTRLIVDQE